jgi:hypothetical protein
MAGLGLCHYLSLQACFQLLVSSSPLGLNVGTSHLMIFECGGPTSIIVKGLRIAYIPSKHTTLTYNSRIMAFLLAIAVILVSPGPFDKISGLRITAMIASIAAVVVEAVWVATSGRRAGNELSPIVADRPRSDPSEHQPCSSS